MSALPGGRLTYSDLPGSVKDELWRQFKEGLLALDSAGKLTAVLIQFPRWFLPRRENYEYLEEAKERLGQFPLAVEFRNKLWLEEKRRPRLFRFLRDREIVYTCVDEPQGFASSVPPLAEVTVGSLALVRYHGRNPAYWEKAGASVQERFNYLYSEQELQEWAAKTRYLAENAAAVHQHMNTNDEDKPIVNARTLHRLLKLAGLDAPGVRRENLPGLPPKKTDVQGTFLL